MLTIGVALTGTQFCGFVVNHVDIAPRYAGVLFGISNSIAAMCGFFAPYVVGLITKDVSEFINTLNMKHVSPLPIQVSTLTVSHWLQASKNSHKYPGPVKKDLTWSYGAIKHLGTCLLTSFLSRMYTNVFK